MSASRIPTLSPRSRKPKARLAAVVDLPTPPLPDATAMIEPTPGTSGFCACGSGGAPCARWARCRGLGAAARARLGGEHGRDRQHARQRLDRLLGFLAQGLEFLGALA